MQDSWRGPPHPAVPKQMLAVADGENGVPVPIHQSSVLVQWGHSLAGGLRESCTRGISLGSVGFLLGSGDVNGPCEPWAETYGFLDFLCFTCHLDSKMSRIWAFLFAGTVTEGSVEFLQLPHPIPGG